MGNLLVNFTFAHSVGGLLHAVKRFFIHICGKEQILIIHQIFLPVSVSQRDTECHIVNETDGIPFSENICSVQRIIADLHNLLAAENFLNFDNIEFLIVLIGKICTDMYSACKLSNQGHNIQP